MITRGQKIGIGIGLGVSALGLFFLWRRSKKKNPKSPALPAVPGAEVVAPPVAPVSTVPPAPIGSWFSACSLPAGAIDPIPAAVPSPGALKSTAEISEALSDIVLIYGLAIAKNVEKIFRLETGNFSSGGYLATGSAGMIPAAKTFPYGWGSMEKLWKENPHAAPVGVVRFCVGGKIYPYLAFPEFYGFLPVAEKLKNNGNNPGKWNSNDPAAIASYNSAISKISAKLV